MQEKLGISFFQDLSKMKIIRRFAGHIIVWLLLIIFCNSFNWIWQGFSVEEGTLLWPSIYGSIFNAAIVYFNILYLYPRKEQIKNRYWLIAVGIILVASLIEAFIDVYYARVIGSLSGVYEGIRIELLASDFKYDIETAVPILGLYNFILNNTFVHVVFWVLSYAYILPIQNAKNLRYREQLEREKLLAELRFLRAQINPHSLFNGINSVYHLIDQDQEQAKEMLLQLSNLLRYQVYECARDFIPLNLEIDFLRNYFKMEEIRKKDHVAIEFHTHLENVESTMIAPLLFIPLVENAFKYVSAHEDINRNFIRCSLDYYHEQLHFIIENSKEEYGNKKNKSSGIGLSNVKERLSLMYPGRHSLNIFEDGKIFKVELTLNFYGG